MIFPDKRIPQNYALPQMMRQLSTNRPFRLPKPFRQAEMPLKRRQGWFRQQQNYRMTELRNIV
jgi:hypothetical protein